MPSRRATQSELWPLFPATPRGELYNRKAVLTGNARLPKGRGAGHGLPRKSAPAASPLNWAPNPRRKAVLERP